METSEPKIKAKFYGDKSAKHCVKERKENGSQYKCSSNTKDEYDSCDPKCFPFHDPSIRKPEEKKK